MTKVYEANVKVRVVARDEVQIKTGTLLNYLGDFIEDPESIEDEHSPYAITEMTCTEIVEVAS